MAETRADAEAHWARHFYSNARRLAAELDAARREVERLRAGMFMRGISLDDVPWIDCHGCGPLGHADSPTPHGPGCWVAALLEGRPS